MRILAWNIRSGGGRRTNQIGDAIAAHSPDTVILSEFRNGKSGQTIQNRLHDLGLRHQYAIGGPPLLNTLLVASKSPFVPRCFVELNEHGHRCLLAEFNGLNVTGVYFPQMQQKRSVFEFLLALPDAIRSGNSLLIGDFNTGKHLLDENGKTFHCADCIDRLESAGWIDVWRRDRPDVRDEFTWLSHVGNGFRIDHAFASAALASRVKNVRYSHDERLAKTSDHSILLLDVT